MTHPRLALFQNFIVTANDDGSIPINSRMIAEITKDSLDAQTRQILQDALERAWAQLRSSDASRAARTPSAHPRTE